MELDKSRGTKQTCNNSEPEEASEAKMHWAFQAIVKQLHNPDETFDLDLDKKH